MLISRSDSRGFAALRNFEGLRLPVPDITSSSDSHEFVDLKSNADRQRATLEKRAAKRLNQSKIQPVWHVIVLNVLSFMAYHLFWFYKNWRDLAEHAESKDQTAENLTDTDFALRHFKEITPILRTVGMLVPMLNVYIAFDFFLDISQLNPNTSSFSRRQPKVAATLAIVFFYGLLFLCRLPEAFYLLYLAAAVPLAVAQHWLNQYWRSQESDSMQVRYAFTGGELIMLIAGAAWMGLIVTGFSVK